jgi:ribosomal-protein-serine acetyltransferase
LFEDKKLYGQLGTVAIILKENNKMIGLIQLHSKDNVNKNCKLAYILGYNYNGHGYMKEAAERILDFAFDKLDFHRIPLKFNYINSGKIAFAIPK